MTEVGPCPEISVLSSFLDKELSEPESETFKSHLRNCPACSRRLKGLESGDGILVRELRKKLMTSSEKVPKGDCVTPETMASYLHDLLSVEEKSRIEGHLDRCDTCLNELTVLARTEKQLSQSRVEPLPNFLKERVEALWKEDEKTKEQILRVAVRLVKDGLEVLRDSLFPQAVSFQEVFAPAGAYRAAPKDSLPTGVSIKRNLQSMQLSLMVQREKEDRASLRITLENEKSNPLEGKRVLLRREQVLLQSERTDAEGVVVISNLEPGAYQLGIVILEKEYHVDLEINQG